MSCLKLYLFGSPRLEADAAEVDVRPRKAMALLIYLAVTQQPHSRDALATLLWPESDQVAARASLRRTLYLLQQALPADLLLATGDTIRLATDGALWLDIAEYQRLVESANAASTPGAPLNRDAHQALLAASALYTGDFLAGFTLDDAPAFDEWQFFQQESLRQSLAHVLQQLQQSYIAAGDFAAAIDPARRRLALDPLHEPAQRDLMLLYAWAGQHAAALRQYQECVRLLDEELGVEPEAETVALYQAIRTKQTPLPPTVMSPMMTSPMMTSPMMTSPTVTLPPALSIPTPMPVHSNSITSTPNLPLHTTTFVGRAHEVAHIYRLMTEEANCRLLTLVGPSGIGKTRLALEVVQRILANAGESGSQRPFADGVIFVPLTPVSEPSGMVAAIAAAAGLQVSSGLSSQEQLLNYLHDKDALIVLDHVEHLLAGASLLAEILRAAPRVKLLATSLEGIHLQDAWFLPIGTLSFPAKHFTPLSAVDEARLRDYDAIRLFEQRAQQVRAGFSLEAEAVHVIRICQLVEGMPLALELAASWLKVLSAERIADEIARGMDILTTGNADVPARHRSMRAVLEQSWSLLQRPERAIFKRLSIFRDGFTAEAAHAVVGAELMMLATLVDKSLLQLHHNGRYHCHEFLRQFAAEQLDLWADEFEEVNAAHCAYYMDFLRQHGQGIKGRGQQRALAEISADISNVMVAWRTAVAQRALGALAAAAPCIWLFSHYRGMLDEGELAFAHALEALASDEADRADPQRMELTGFLTAGQGWMQGRRGDLTRGRAQMEAGLAQIRQAAAHNPETEAFVVTYLALLAQYQERQLEARQLVNQSLDAYTTLGDLWGMAVGLEIAGTAAIGYGQLEEAKQLLTQCLTIAQAAGELRSRLLAMTYLGLIAVSTGNYAEAYTLLDEALTMSTELGDRIATAVILTQLGKYALADGDAPAALHHLQQSLANLRAAGVDYPAEVLDCLCATHCSQGNLAEAKQTGRQALHMAQARGIQRRILTSLSMLGCVAHARQEYAHAIELQHQALTLCRATGHEPDLASILRYLGHAYTAQLLRDETPPTEYELHKNMRGEGVSNVNVRNAAVQHACQAYQEALQLALKHRLAPVALDCLVGVATLLFHFGDAEPAGELLHLVATHPAAEYDTRRRATALSATHAVPEPGHEGPADWQAAVAGILDQMALPDWGQPRQLLYHLPTYPTPFVGRQQEIIDISQNLLNPDCRMLALVGLGGIGKTRLAVEVARHLAATAHGVRLFSDGIVFVSLAAVQDEDTLIAALAEALGIAPYGTQPLRQQLMHALAQQHLLLILDNVEQVSASEPLLGEILQQSRGVKVLATSRVAPDVLEAWFYPVGGMSFPTECSTTPLESFESVQLFVQSARRVRANFVLDQTPGSTTAQAVAQICQLVEGMPLALELAASWLKVLIVENIAEEISRGLEILATHGAGNRAAAVNARHQSMRVVMEQTWTLLSSNEQQAFMRLALLRGGFRRDAADKVAGATLPLLAQLVEKSLLRVNASGRYSIHELLRQFALEKLQALSAGESEAWARYSAYYLDFMVNRVRPVAGWHKDAAMRELEEEIDNITGAWQWRFRQHDLDTIERTLAAYSHFLWLRGHGQIGCDVFAQALQDLVTSPEARTHPRYAVLHQRLAQELGSYYYFLADFEAAAATIQLALDGARHLGDKIAAAEALTTLGTIMAWQGKRTAAHTYWEEAVAIFTACDDNNGLSDVLHEQARLAVYEGDYVLGRTLATQALACAESLPRPEWRAYALMECGICNFYLGLYAEAQRDLDQALALFEGQGHAVGTAFALGELAWLTWATGGTQSAEAEARARASLEIARRVGHRLQISYRLAQLAQFANDRRDFAEATRFAEEGLALATTINTPHFISQNYCMLAEAAYQQQEFAHARHHLAQACRVATGAGFTGRVLLTVYHAALLLTLEDTTGKAATALQWLELCVQHPASWHVVKARAAQQLAFVRAQAPEAARMAEKISEDAAHLHAQLAQATQTIMAWAGEEIVVRV